jgi:acyl-CoA synthetase (AMP-forming)/AMP-acid ligase II
MRVDHFDATMIICDLDGTKRYGGLPDSLVHMLSEAARRIPDQEALVEIGGPRLTYRALWERATRVAGGLRSAGISRGDRVAIRLRNGVDWVLAFYGSLLAGAIAVPVNIWFTDKEVTYVVDDSGAAYVFTDDRALPDGEPYVATDLKPADPAAIFYTSGTTGFPKGAVTSHTNFLSNCENNRRTLLEGSSTFRTLISAPLFHVTGCNSQLLLSAYLGGTAVVLPAFEASAFLGAIEKERINVLITVPAIYWLAMNHTAFAAADVSSVEILVCGGAPVAPDLYTRITRSFPDARVGNGFGLTESAGMITYRSHEYGERYADSVGFPAPVCDVRLADVADDGVGELLVRGANVVSGYWNKPEATAAAFTDGWLRTGDLAQIDSSGVVRIVDRLKDVIIRGGENVYCVEVENALAGAPGVFESAVIGVPDPVLGEKVGAVLVPIRGLTIDPRAVIEHLRHNIAEFKFPQYVAIRTEPLPRNPGGKLLRTRLREETVWKPIS